MTYSEFLEKEPETLRKKLRVLLAGFSDAAQVDLVRVPAGECVLRQGDARSSVFVLVAGRVLNVVRQQNFTSYAFYEYTPVEFFGEQEALAGIPNIIADVRAKTNCRFLALSEADYLRWVQSDTQIMQRQVRDMLALLLGQAAHERAALFFDSDARMALFLAHYYQHHPPAHPGGHVTVRQGHAAIAEEIGMSLRTVNRSVKKLAEAGAVGLAKGKMTLTAEQYMRLKVSTQKPGVL